MKNIKALIQAAKKSGKKVGFISGVFDILHIGHIRLFEFAKKHCDFLVVCLDNDATVRAFKGSTRPMFKEDLRAEILRAIRFIDLVFVNPSVISTDPKLADKQYLELLKELGPDVLITSKTSDRFWVDKKKRAKKLGIIFLDEK